MSRLSEYLSGPRKGTGGYKRERLTQITTPEYRINRFPIMASLAYCIAKDCGYNEQLSRSLGVGVATGYAILKNIGYYSGTMSKARAMGKKTLEDYLFNDLDQSLGDYENIGFCGIEFIRRKGENGLLGIRRIRGRQYPFNSNKFNFQASKLDNIRPQGFKYLCGKIKEEMRESKINSREISSRPKASLFFEFWKQIRDKFRTPEFWK